MMKKTEKRKKSLWMQKMRRRQILFIIFTLELIWTPLKTVHALINGVNVETHVEDGIKSNYNQKLYLVAIVFSAQNEL